MTRLALIMSLVLAATSAFAQEDTIVDRRYSSAKLDVLWSSTLGGSGPEIALFEMLDPGSPEATEPVSENVPEFGLPGLGEIIGESASPSGAPGGLRLSFPVVPLAPEEAGLLVRRLAWAEIYLTRYEFYERASTDTAEVLDQLAARQMAAGIEAYLAHARLYFAAPEMLEKCQSLRRMTALSTRVLAARDAVRLSDGWEALAPLYEATVERLEASPLAALVCSVDPVRGRGETIRIVETRVRETIATAARDKIDDTLTLLDAAAAEFQTLVNQMDVEIKSAEILDLERRFGNAASNLRLVKEDGLKADTTIAALNAVDLSQLNQPGQLQDLETAQSRMLQMSDQMRIVLNALAELADVTGDPQVAASLAPCATLRDLYQTLDFSLDTGVLTARVQASYNACLLAAQTAAETFNEPTLQAAFMAELAHQVRRISENYLASQR